MLRVAVVGSGPAGIYTAEALVRSGAVTVDVLDRLPAPYGLVRYGVAPDHLKIKSIAAALQKVLEGDGVRFLGNIDLGADVDVADLRACYDAVVYAYGASVDRRLGVPGEDLPGSFSATEFVAWYCGHPDSSIDRFTLDASSVAIIGVGNVAIDVARILVKPTDELRSTDLSDHVLGVLERSRVEDVSIIGRRGPAQAKFTTKELRELGEIAGVDVVVRPGELLLDEASEAALAAQPVLRRNLETLREWSERPLTGQPRRLHLRFLLRPVQLVGESAVSGVHLQRTELDGTGQVTDAGTAVAIDAQMVLRSVGYRGSPLPGLPFDERTGVIPNDAGRVLRAGSAAPGEYVVGWIKRGPTGVIGTNKHDAQETVTALLADAEDGRLAQQPGRDADALVTLLAARGVTAVSYRGWQAIDAAEMALGQAQGRSRVKIADRAELLAAARTPPD